MYSSHGPVAGWEVSRHTCVEVVNAAAADIGGLDVVINNAGIPGMQLIDAYSGHFISSSAGVTSKRA